MLLVSFDPARNRVSVLSLPRDTRVHIPGHSGYDKINAAYAYGGVKLAKQTVSNLLQVPIDFICRWTGRALSKWWICWAVWTWTWKRI